MTNELIGKVTLTPETVVPGESIKVEVTGPKGEKYPINGDVYVRIDGRLGATQWLQASRPGTRTVFVSASRNGTVEHTKASFEVLAPDAPPETLSLTSTRIRALASHPGLGTAPLLNVERSPSKHYTAAFHLGRPVARTTDFATAPLIGAPRHLDARPVEAGIHALAGAAAHTKEPAAARAAGPRLEGVAKLMAHQHKAGEPHGRAVPPAMRKIAVERARLVPLPGGLGLDTPSAGSRRAGLRYVWDFGDGHMLATDSPTIEHDYDASLSPDEEHHLFDVSVRIENPDQEPVTVRRTLYVHHTYALCKKRGTIVMKAENNVFAARTADGWRGMAKIRNIEDFPIKLTSRVVRPMSTNGDDPNKPGPAEQLTAPIEVPAHGSVTVNVAVPDSALPDNLMGFAVGYWGTADGGKKVCVETHFDIPARFRKNAPPMLGNIAVAHMLAPHRPGPAPSRNELGAAGRALHGTGGEGKPTGPALVAKAKLPAEHLGAFQKLAEALQVGLPRGPITTKSGTVALEPEEGAPCDPDNLPDDIADDPDSSWACQVTGEPKKVPTPGRFVNAQKGDIVLSPGGPGMIGQLLRQVHPPQVYSHSGMMTRNFDQITHCTMSEKRLMKYPVGHVGKKPVPTDGHRPDVVKFGWPGTITQNIEEALYGEQYVDPERNDLHFNIHGFSRGNTQEEVGGTWELIPALVIKPDPIAEAIKPELRIKLHQVASDARDQTGKTHYRFFCYTDPRIAEDPSKRAPEDCQSVWAQTTWPAVCSSFIWHMCRKHGLHLEAGHSPVTGNDLEASDIANGAEVDGTTEEGLYRYTAHERLMAGIYLYQSLVDKVDATLNQQAGALAGIIELFSGIEDDVANQIVNTFASDWADTASKDSDAWRNTSDANAVSPDNLLWWDTPWKLGFYGHAVPLVYRDPRVEFVQDHVWHKVQEKGTVTGVVRYKGEPQKGAMVQLYDGKSTFTFDNGRYTIEHVPLGKYVAKASAQVEGLYMSGAIPFTLDGAEKEVDILLYPPSDQHRRLTIKGQLHIHDHHAIGHDPDASSDVYREMFVDPINTHADAALSITTDEGDNVATVSIAADWHHDKSITVQWTFVMSEGGHNEDTDTGAFTLPAGMEGAASRQMVVGGKSPYSHDSCRFDLTFSNEINPDG